jgi:hypothetical protein
MMDIALDHEYKLWHSLATILLGATNSAIGKTEEGLAQIEKGIATYLGHKSPPVFWPQLTALRAEAYGRAGRPIDGLNLLDELLGTENAELILRQFPELVLLKGDLLLIESPANTPVVQDIFSHLVSGAQAVGGKMLALRAATRLCRLEMQGENGVESCRALAAIYESFTEGFESADLQTARNILDQWHG